MTKRTLRIGTPKTCSASPFRNGLATGEGRHRALRQSASIASATFRRAVLDHLDDEQVREAVESLRRAVQQVNAAAPGTGRAETPVPGLPVPATQPGKWLLTAGGLWVYPDQWQVDTLAREAKISPDALTEGCRVMPGLETATGGQGWCLLAPGGPVSSSSWLALVPRDTVFVRDGRSFDAAADSTAQGVMPGPASGPGGSRLPAGQVCRVRDQSAG
jgi:hypothetical protein